jgi:hypothetical protein
MSKRPDYKKEILEYISDHPYGVNISEISEDKNFARNTVYKYLDDLTNENLVYKKEIGVYALYYSRDKSILIKDGIVSFFKGLMSNIKNVYPEQEEVYKLIGRNIAASMDIPFTSEGREYLKSLKNATDLELIEAIPNYITYFNILQDSVTISKIDIKKQEKRAIVTFKNSDMLENTDDYIYYFYLIMGLIEKKLSEYTGKEVKFDVVKYEAFEEKENSYINFSFNFQVLLPKVEIEGISEVDVPGAEAIDISLIKMDVMALNFAYILRGCFLKKKILFLNDKEFLHSHLNNFIEFIFQDSFEIDVTVELNENYKKNKKKYAGFLVLGETGVISDKDKVLKEKEIKIERKIIQDFIAEGEPKSSLHLLRYEIQIAHKLATELSKKVKTITKQSRDKKVEAKQILDDLTNIYDVKISLPYLKFLVEIVENYFELEVPPMWKFFLLR